MAPPLAAHQLPGGLMTQKSVSGTRSRAAGAASLGAPLGSFPTSTVGASTPSGRHGAGQRRAAGGVGAARAAGAAGAGGGPSKPGGGKKGLAASKAKQNTRFHSAVPQGVDVMEHDLRGYVLECGPPRHACRMASATS